MLRQRLSQEESLSIATKSYYTFTKDGIAADSDTMVFSVSSSSIDRVIGARKPPPRRRQQRARLARD
eukprot:1480931-Prymnesium_polylepis.1